MRFSNGSLNLQMQKQPLALGVASLAGILIGYRNRMQKFMMMRGTYDIKEADALQVLRYDT